MTNKSEINKKMKFSSFCVVVENLLKPIFLLFKNVGENYQVNKASNSSSKKESFF